MRANRRGWKRRYGVYRLGGPYGGPLNVLNSGRDAPLGFRGKLVWVTILILIVASALYVLVLSIR